jgi:hypothetical protein
MPQLDKFAFAPQVFWLVLVFFVLYLLLLKDGLPTLYKIIVFRKRLILHLSVGTTLSLQESFFLNLFSSRFLINFFSTRNLLDPLFKLLDSNLASVSNRTAALKSIRLNFVLADLNVSVLGSKQFVSPLTSRYSTLKLL